MNCGRRHAVAALLLAGFPLPRSRAAGASRDLRIVVGDESPTQRQIVQALLARFPDAPVDREVSRLRRAVRPTAYVAIGPAALGVALNTPLDGPLVSLFTSRQTLTRLLAERDRAIGGSVTGIYAEPSPDQQLQLIAALYQRRITVGALVSPQTAYITPLLERAARERRLDLSIQRVETDGNVVRSLNALTHANVLLLFPDSSLYTAENLRQLLEASYRRTTPVVGFSAGLVNAGALASAISSVDDTLAQLDAMLESLSAGRVPEPQYPRYWSVVVNERVARSLNVVVDDTVRTLGNRPP